MYVCECVYVCVSVHFRLFVCCLLVMTNLSEVARIVHEHYLLQRIKKILACMYKYKSAL